MNTISGGDVLDMLIPTGGWVITADDFNSIKYDDGVEPITKAQFEAGFGQYEAWKAEQDATKATQRQALLTRLGITEDEARLLLG
jgi:hypothetical protein